MDNIYKNIEEYSPNKKRGRELNIFIFITHSYFKVPINVRLDTMHFK